MGLESGSYINDLVTTNPVGSTDAKSEGDNHIRLIKTVVKGTFPGMAGRAWRKQSKAGDYTGVANDNMSLIEFTAAATFNLTAAATLGNGWMCMFRTNGGGITIDPASTEQVNGATTKAVPDGYMGILFCDGSAFWMSYWSLGQQGFESGTRMTFQQTAAPTTWTKDTTAGLNGSAMRIVTGSVSSGGADAFTSVFAASKTVTGTSLTQAQLPNCSFNVSDPGHTHTVDVVRGQLQSNASTNTNEGVWGTTNTGSATTGITVSSGGSGSTHNHTVSTMDLKYYDVIVATKD